MAGARGGQYGRLVGEPTKWVTQTSTGHSQWYIQRFRNLAASGADLAGEARLVDAMVPRNSRILDAGCGTGRLGAELAARGHDVVGVDADPELIEAAAADHPGPQWLVADLADPLLLDSHPQDRFAAIVVAGNVMTFLADGTHQRVLRNLRDQVEPDGVILVGFGTGRGYSVAEFDRDLTAAGLVLEHRFATWDLRPWDEASDFAVSVLRVSGE
jgi:SAM-dependent methyltransferase